VVMPDVGAHDLVGAENSVLSLPRGRRVHLFSVHLFSLARARVPDRAQFGKSAWPDRARRALELKVTPTGKARPRRERGRVRWRTRREWRRLQTVARGFMRRSRSTRGANRRAGRNGRVGCQKTRTEVTNGPIYEGQLEDRVRGLGVLHTVPERVGRVVAGRDRAVARPGVEGGESRVVVRLVLSRVVE
jgi:hypothetical protein